MRRPLPTPGAEQEHQKHRPDQIKLFLNAERPGMQKQVLIGGWSKIIKISKGEINITDPNRGRPCRRDYVQLFERRPKRHRQQRGAYHHKQ